MFSSLTAFVIDPVTVALCWQHEDFTNTNIWILTYFQANWDFNTKSIKCALVKKSLRPQPGVQDKIFYPGWWPWVCMCQFLSISIHTHTCDKINLLFINERSCSWLWLFIQNKSSLSIEHLRIHDTLVPKTTANLTFMPYLCCHLINNQSRMTKVRECLVRCYFRS